MAEKFIDIEKVINDRNPKLLKWLPKFFIRYVKRIAHQDDLNKLMEDNEGVYGLDFCIEVIKEWNITVNVKGAENIPKQGGAIFTCNHPLGGIDGIVLAYGLSKHRSDVRLVVNDLILNVKNLQGISVGVNKLKNTGKSALQEMHDMFKSDHAITLFPAGLVSRRVKGKIEDPEWRKTFVTRAKVNNKLVVPVFLSGQLSNFFYRLSNIRKFLGIKMNIEMFYLANELYKQYGKTINITFGEPIASETFDKSKKDKEWAQWVKKKVYDLA